MINALIMQSVAITTNKESLSNYENAVCCNCNRLHKTHYILFESYTSAIESSS